MPKKTGFTLVELLITITIISILSAIGLVVYGSVMQQGRNSKRQSDLRSVQSALEQYYADQFFYPTAISLDGSSSLMNTTGNPNSVSSTKTYLNTIPGDPNASPYSQYVYTVSPSACDNMPLPAGIKCTSYCLFAVLEGISTSQIPGTCTPPNNSYNFAVTLP